MGRKFNPPPGWPVHYGFEPPPGWQPDPDWPPAPPGWPLWIGSDAPRGALGGGSGGYVTGYPRQQQWSTQSAWPPGYYPPASHFPSPLTSRRRRTVRSMVIAVIVVAFIAIGGAVKAAIDAAHRSPTTGRIVKKGHLDVFSLRTGDCFQSRPFSALAHGVAGVRAVPCRAAHNAQVFAQFRAPDLEAYPGRKHLIGRGSHGCAKRLGVIDRSKAPRSVRVGIIYPNSVAWLEGYRKISCIVRDTRGGLKASLLRPGAGRRRHRSPRGTRIASA